MKEVLLLILMAWTLTSCSPMRKAVSPQLASNQMADGIYENSMAVFKNARFTVVSPELIRMEYSPTSQFVNEKTLFASERNERFEGAQISLGEIDLKINTGKIEVTYKPDGRPFHAGNLTSRVIFADSREVLWTPGMKNKQNLGGTIPTLDRTVRPIPLSEEGLISRDGWYVLDDSKGHILFGEGADEWIQSRPENQSTIDWFFFGYGSDFKSALRAFIRVGGRVPIPRKYMLGSWYSWHWPFNSDDYRDLVTKYSQAGFPLDGLVIDMDWHRDGWTGYSWNDKLFPDREKLFRDLHDKGIRVTFNDHPADGVQPHEDMYGAFMADIGKNPKDGPIPFDATDKKYMDTFFKHTHHPFDFAGLDFWWLDWQQDFFTRGIPDLKSLPWLNRYFFKDSMKTGLRGQSLSRWGGWGDHKHPVHFSGDTGIEFPMLEFQVPFTSNAGNVGLFYWSHDIGGFCGYPRNEETMARWVQFGAMSPVLRLHSCRETFMDKRPWSFGPEAQNSMRKAFRLRSELFPYIYSTAWQGYHDALPLLRPMYLEHPGHAEAYRNPQQYYFGESLIVAPITTPSVGPGKLGRQSVWFPEGLWYNLFTGERYSGDAKYLVSSPIDEFPIFAKGGFPIVMQPFAERMGSAPLSTLRVRTYPGFNGQLSQSVLYEDDGVTAEYISGYRSVTPVRYQREENLVTMTVGKASGPFAGQLENRDLVFEFPNTVKAEVAYLNGSAVAVQYLEDSFTNVVRINGTSVREELTLKIELADYNPQIIAQKFLKRNLKALLGAYDETTSLASLIKLYGSQGSSSTLESLLALANIGFDLRSAGIHTYPNDKTELDIFNGSEFLPGVSASYSVADQGSGEEARFAVSGSCPSSRRYCPHSLNPLSNSDKNLISTVSERRAKIDFNIEGQNLTFEKVTDKTQGALTAWNIIGPFKLEDVWLDLRKVDFGPEQFPRDMNHTYDNGMGGRVGWVAHDAFADGLVDLKILSPNDAHGKVAYAVTELVSEVAQTIYVTVAADDRIELLLDGKSVYVSNDFRGFSDVRERVAVNIPAGSHTLMAEVANWQADWGFNLKVEAERPLRQRRIEK